jgi:4-amino-4-deoxy-L-arabinose transferase-like glycosyltransferase
MKLAIGTTARELSQPGRDAVGAEIALAAACLVAIAAFKLLQPMLPEPVTLPLVVTIFFVMAATAALWAWFRGVPSRTRQLNYWDVSGLLTLIGICLAAVIEPEGLVQLVATDDRAAK